MSRKGYGLAYTVTVRQGNLVTEPGADFIVNASNTQLMLGSGVSAAFARHCGPRLQEAMTHTLLACGRLEKGDVVATETGEAENFDVALHAAVMDYNPGIPLHAQFPSLNDLKVILFNIEKIVAGKAAIEKRKFKLVLPLMGCGVGGLLKADVVDLYKRFFSREVAFECEAVVYGHSPDDYRLISDEFSS